MIERQPRQRGGGRVKRFSADLAEHLRAWGISVSCGGLRGLPRHFGWFLKSHLDKRNGFGLVRPYKFWWRLKSHLCYFDGRRNLTQVLYGGLQNLNWAFSTGKIRKQKKSIFFPIFRSFLFPFSILSWKMKQKNGHPHS